MTKFLLLPALSTTLLAAAPALADEEAASREVSIAPAELTTEAGAAAVHARISQAALAACRAENRGGAAPARSVRICTQDTVARTVAALDAPLLTAEHLGQANRIRLASLLR
jgi:UrcA family protein